MPAEPLPVRVDVGLTAADLDAALRRDVAAGLVASPKELPCKWFYDEAGCALFDDITRLPEYYPTRQERAILERRAEAVAELTAADTVVEIGSGNSDKTRLLLDAFARRRQLRRFIPFDVSEATLRAAAGAVAAEYPGVEIHAVVGDFEQHLALVPDTGRRVVVFLGSTIGNLTPERRADFLAAVGASMAPGEAFLLGTDLVKDVERLEAAYDDAAGVTAAFNRNMLSRLNRELGADFVPERFDHVARFDTDQEWIDIRLRSQTDQTVRVADLGLEVDFAAGEEMRTEISAKFRQAGVTAELVSAGLEPVHFWTDPDGDFALTLAFAK